jgi:CPA2 family monovalent cation:H+ antiporter-2
MNNGDILSALVPVIVLLLLGIVTAIASRVVGVSPIVGYILLGLILRAIGEPTVPTQSSIKLFSELGILFLLFEIGLHFSAKQIREHASDIFAFGPLQVVFATVGLSSIALCFGIAAPAAALIGGILSLSSTAVVERLIIERRQRSCPVGLTAVAVLVFQDLAGILLLVVEGALGAGKAVGAAVAIAVAKATFALIVTILGARLVAEPLLNLIARSRNDEVFTATALLIASRRVGRLGRSDCPLLSGRSLVGLP